MDIVSKIHLFVFPLTIAQQLLVAQSHGAIEGVAVGTSHYMIDYPKAYWTVDSSGLSVSMKY